MKAGDSVRSLIFVYILFLPVFGTVRPAPGNCVSTDDGQAVKSQPDIPSTLIRVVNEKGEPVKNAKIKPCGMRTSAGLAAHFPWPADFPVQMVQTDDNGRAKLSYPGYTGEKEVVLKVTIGVKHPDYVPLDWLDIDVSKGTETQIVLKRGATVKIIAWIDDPKQPVQDNVWLVRKRGTPKKWKKSEDNIWCLKNISSGDNFLMVVHKPAKGPLLFSDPVIFSAQGGRTIKLNLQLKPGVTLKGKLSQAVTRPVKKARAMLNVFPMPQKWPYNICWMSETNIAEDGSFEFHSLPRGKAEVVVVMPGRVSRNPKKYAGSHSRKPQVVSTELSAGSTEAKITVAMEQAATAKIKVVNRNGAPVSDVSVLFYPNMTWGRYSSQLLGQHLPCFEKIIRSGTELPEGWWKQDKYKRPYSYSSKTDKTGIAVVNNLPAGKICSFSVGNKKWTLPLREVKTGKWIVKTRQEKMELKPGRTTCKTVTVVKNDIDNAAKKQ